MKIIFANRSNYLSAPGGDTVQMIKTIEYIKNNYNIEVSICTSPDEILRDKEASIVHIFNIQNIDETLNLVKVSKESGKKVVLSTIYWDLSHSIYVYKMFKMFRVMENIRYIKNLKDIFIKMAFIRKCFPNNKKIDSFTTKQYIEKRRKVLIEADFILPNSNEELDIICKEFNLKKADMDKKAYIIPNAVDINKDKEITTCINIKSNNLKELKNFVLEVGRIEINKNQYGIVKALFDKPEIPIVFIGRVGDDKFDKIYYDRLKKLSDIRGNVFFINQIPQEEVFEYYKKARVHVLPSFRESPGLSSLEALYFGCEIVTSSSEFCPIEYYKFDKKAHICDPYNFKSIKKAILEADNNPKNNNFDDEYFKFYSYDNVSLLLNQVYNKLIK